MLRDPATRKIRVNSWITVNEPWVVAYQSEILYNS